MKKPLLPKKDNYPNATTPYNIKHDENPYVSATEEYYAPKPKTEEIVKKSGK